MRNNRKPLVLVAVLLVCGTAVADSTSDMLTRIEAETMLLKARERQLDVQANIISRQNEIAAKQGMNNLITQSATAGDPVVHAIEGMGGTLYATLQMSDGNLTDVQVGDVLSNGMRVISIAPSNVVVASGKRQIRLAGHAMRAAPFNPSHPPPGLALPLPAQPPRGVAR